LYAFSPEPLPPPVRERPRQTPPVVSEVLREYGTATRSKMEEYLRPQRPQPYFHELLSDYPRRGGKMMRSSLCIATARALGASLEEAVGSAAAIELLHNAMLIHDDIEDESDIRRNRPALHVLHGIPLAVNAGDGLLLLSLRPLLDNVARIGSRRATGILRETDRMAWESAEGQAMDLGWRRENRLDLGDADYLTMVLKKTSWLSLIYPSRVGAIIGTKGAVGPDRFIRFGFFLGAAFQIQDDLLNLVADPAYGKELCGDLLEGKRTLMVMHAYRNARPADQATLAAILALPREERGTEEVMWIRDLMEAHGSITYASKVAHGLAGAALHEFGSLYDGLPETRDKAFIRGLITWVFERG
jgi:geranylgeranyl diphosphate synthase, type II